MEFKYKKVCGKLCPFMPLHFVPRFNFIPLALLMLLVPALFILLAPALFMLLAPALEMLLAPPLTRLVSISPTFYKQLFTNYSFIFMA